MKNQKNPTNFSRALFTEYIPKNPLIVEAGAHNGRDTLKLLNLLPNATIHAFEPVPELFSTLQKQCSPYKAIHCYNIALSDTTQEQPMYVATQPYTAISSLMEPFLITQERPTVSFQKQTVTTTTLATWAHKQGINHIDFLWLDAQGSELAILEGASSLIQNVSLIYTEVTTSLRYKNNPLRQDIDQWMQNHGFIPKILNMHHVTWGSIGYVKERC